MNLPLVSIVLTVYNASKYLEKCLNSIVSQKYKNWELIIINDGSTDNSGEMISQFISTLHNKVAYINLPQNKGLPYSFNLGIQHSKGKYIAKIDADDIMFDTRLTEQVHFLEKHKEIGVIGSGAIEIDENDQEIGIMTVPLDDFNIKKLLLSTYPIIHPTVMIRREIFSQGIHYRDLYPRSEDLDLWLRLSNFVNFANLEHPLIKKRTHSEQFTMSKEGHYYSLRAKIDFFLKNGILLKNLHHLIRHIFIIVFIPNVLYIFLKKDEQQKRKNNYETIKKNNLTT